jgi:hypothetical protein
VKGLRNDVKRSGNPGGQLPVLSWSLVRSTVSSIWGRFRNDAEAGSASLWKVVR